MMLLYNIKQSMSVYGFIEWVLLLFSVALKWQHSITPRVCLCMSIPIRANIIIVSRYSFFYGSAFIEFRAKAYHTQK